VFSKRSQDEAQQLAWVSVPAILSFALCVAGFAFLPT
jgi:hypothetical protein